MIITRNLHFGLSLDFVFVSLRLAFRPMHFYVIA